MDKILFTMVDSPGEIFVFRKSNPDRPPSLQETFRTFVEEGRIFQAHSKDCTQIPLWINGAHITRWRLVRDHSGK